MNYFERKVIVITGSSSRIGEGAAIHFAKLNACVVVIGGNSERVQSVAEKCRLLSKNTILEIKIDFQNDDDVKIMVEKIIDTFGRIDIIVNNARIANYGCITDKDSKKNFDVIMNTNLRSAVLLISLIVPYLENTKGCIINISSLAATKLRKNWLFFGMSKAGMVMLTKCLAMELGLKGIIVNAISPNMTATPLYHTLKDFKITEEQIEMLCKSLYPLGRVGHVEDMVHAIEILSSEKASFITGLNMIVDGGAAVSRRSRL